MLAIRRLLNSLVLVDCDQTEVSDGNKENSTVGVGEARLSDRSGRALAQF